MLKTEKLYYKDAYIHEFDATVVSIEEKDGKYPLQNTTEDRIFGQISADRFYLFSDLYLRREHEEPRSCLLL